MNIKAKKAKVQALSKKSVINVLSQDEIKKKVQVIEQELKASTWRELETKGKFEKNDKLSFISEEMLIVGCDISEQLTPEEENSAKELLNSVIHPKALPVQRHGC